MPKKFKGENSKAVEARARKEAAKTAEAEKKQKAQEDAFWADDDKHVQRKQQRKEDREKKRAEQLDKKRELQRLAEEEMNSLKGAKPAAQEKVTRAQIQEQQERLQAEAAAAARKEDVPHDQQPIEENLNRLTVDGHEARSVEEAISVLGSGEPAADIHPEKRVKAAYAKFEEENLPRLKQENPNMRLSQLKQMLKKDWMKSPENPLNQRAAAFNSKS